MSKQNIEDIYPLSPMQQGMLFHRLYATRTDVYFHQAEFTLHGQLDVGAFEQAWERVVSRHPILRSAFIWERGQEPFQVVRQRVKLPLEKQDWRELSRADQQAELVAFLKADRERGIELFKAPLMRLSLIQLADDVSHLVWSHHHMLLDGWSVALVLKEIFTFYEALRRGEDLQLERPRPYGDYIAWLQRQDLKKAEDFWRATLEGFTAPIKLGVERAATTLHEQAQGYDDLKIILTEAEAASLYAFAQQQKLTVNTLVQGAWAVLLTRYSGEEDVVFGAATSGRPVELIGVETMIGNFINTLPARVRVTPEAKTLDWLRQLQQRQVEARQFEYSPLVQIQKWSEIPRRTALFETIVIFENYPVDASLSESRGGLEIGNPHVDDRTNYPLSLVISAGKGFALRIIYDRVSYGADSIQRMLGHLKTILLDMIEQPAELLAYLPMLTPTERRQMLVEWNDTATAYDQDRCIHELFEEQAAATPTAIAVVSDDEQLNYGQLNERANQLAHLLNAAGVGRGTLVAVLLHRSAHMIPALLAILKAGAAYVPIEPAYPKSRIEWILSSHNIDCLITENLLLQTVAELQLPALQNVVCLDADATDEAVEFSTLATQKKIWTRADLQQCPQQNLPPQATAADLAYIIFTSGSTGTPKGVMVTHQPVINLIDWVNRTFDINSSDRLLFITSLCFDLSVYDMFGLLAAGGSIRVVADADIRDPERLLHMLTTEPITFWDSAPAALQQLVPFFPTTKFPYGSRLRLVFMSGDWVPVTLPELLMRTFPNVEVIALGGATEATVWSNFYPVSEVDPAWPSIPYGKPIQNSQYHIADAFLNPCPIGVAGDLYIGGACLATGYIDAPTLTAEKFIPNPFRQTPGDRLYKTGDRARYLSSGDIEFLGRVDNQVKIRGFRIELGEIEAALAQHPAVRAVIVVAREDVPKEKHLVAYLVPGEERAPTISNLLRYEESGELAGQQQQELPNGMMIVYRNKNETDFMFKKIFEDESYLHQHIQLEPGACVFDVGANIGLFSLFIGHVCRDARIYAFEPLPPLFDSLRINTQLHGLDVRLWPCGLGSETKTEEFTFYPNVTLISGRFADAVEERDIVKSFLLNQPDDLAQTPSGDQLDELLTERLQSERIVCQLKTLSDVIRESGVERIDLLKINVEKSELDVLLGIEEADWPKIRQLVVEVHDIDNRLAQISHMLESHGYDLIVEQEEWLKDTGLYNIFAARRDTRAMSPRNEDVLSRPREQQKNVWTSPNRLISDVRDFLKEKLPEYMMPSAFVLLHALPLTSNGKVDRRALPTPGKDRKTLEGTFVPPRTSVEEVLADIWAEVLGVERVGVNDNFFELGGDSILSIQVNARANKAGIKLTTKQLFQFRTIAELADAAASTATAVSAEQGAVTGSVPLTPVQRSFFAEQQPEPQHYNQSLMLELRRPVDVDVLRRAFMQLVAQHDALRLRFTQSAEGDWQQFNAAAAANDFFSVVDLSHLAGAEQTAALETHANSLQASLNLSAGPLLRICYYELGEGQAARLLIIIHHLAVDGVSWRILLEDVASGCEQLAAGQDEIRLGAKTTSYKEWAERLREYAAGEEVREQREYWAEVVRRGRQVKRLPVDHEGGENTVSGARVVEVSLTRAETAALLSEVPAVYRTEINEVLLTALVRAVGNWTGAEQVLVEMEGHGREEIDAGVEVTRTVGWFTTIYPVVLEVAASAGVGEALKAVKEQVRGVRGRGMGWGLLQWLGAAEEIDGLEAELSFNYLGQFDQLFSESSPFSLARESTGAERSLKARRQHLIEINAMVIGGELRINWGYSSAAHHEATIANLAHNYVEALRSLIEHCGATEPIEEFYPLSPVQEGMLFHNLYAPEAGDYVLQSHSLLEQQLDVAAFEQAWQRVVDRHTALRTFFVWEGIKKPIQVVQRQVKLPLEQQDWRGLEQTEQEAALKSFLHEDRVRGFNLNQAPLMRLVLIRLDQQSYYFIWSHHHLLLDGWSLPLIFREVFETYEALRRGAEVKQTRPRPFREYIAWQQQQDMEQAEVFWRQMMSGLKSVPRLQMARNGNHQGETYNEHRLALPAATTTALRALGREQQLTLNTLVQGAVSLLLSHYTSSEEVVFGMTVSGRPAELPEIETMVGVFINVLPMRIRIRADESLLKWLRGIQEQQLEMRQYEYTPLAQIARWSDVPRGQPLFETLLSFENYPVDEILPQIGDRLSIQQHRIESKDNYPLSLGVVPGQQLQLWLTYDSQFAKEAIREFGELFEMLLNSFVTQPEADLKTLQAMLSREREKQQARQRREREENSLQRFKKVKPKAVSLSSDNPVTLETLTPDGVLPLVFRTDVEDLDLAKWAQSHRELIETNLSKHGALLFRGVKLKTAADFEQVAAAICPELFGEYGDLPREGLGGNVYRSTPFPADQSILFHNESAHLHRWPMKIWFFCMKAADEGGETPIVDCREVYKMLDPHLRDRFARKGLLYVRNYIQGLDVSWQSFFQTTDKAAVEAYCRQASIDFEWTSNNNLRTRRLAPAVVRHPKTGEFSFFNQLQLHHISFLAADVRSSLLSLYKEEDLPRNVYYGDGSALEESVLNEILQIYKAAAVSFPWQPGDILMLDNMLIAHGRNPYSGDRKIVVTMGEMVSRA